MRLLLLAALLLTACSQEEAPPPPSTPQIAPGTFAANDRDALCVSGAGGTQRAGFVNYGPGNENCSARGRIVQSKGEWLIEPDGDRDCRIPVTVAKDGIRLGAVTPSCSYYCAPGLSFAGKSFVRIARSSSPPVDIAGDLLC